MKRILAAGLALLLFAGTAMGAMSVYEKMVYSGVGPFKIVTAKVILDDSYLSGGETLAKATLGLTDVIWATVTPDTISMAGYEAEWDWDNELLIVSLLAVSTDPASINIVSDGEAADTIAVNIAATAGTVTSAIVASETDLDGMPFKLTAFGY